MKVHFIILAAIVTLAAPSISAATPPRPGPYASVFLGVSAPRDADATGTYYNYDTHQYSPFDDSVEFDPGINIGGTGGFDYGLVRLEGELSYKHGEMSTVTDQAGVKYRNVDGTLGALAMMFNVFMDLHNTSPVTPYFGGGIGFAYLDLSDAFGSSNDSRIFLYEEDDDSVFAYQVGAGMEISLNRMLSLDLGYRYFATTKAKFVTSYDIDTELKFKSHNAAVGLRVKF